MSARPTATPKTIHSPGAAAALLGITSGDLLAILRRHRYGFTEIKPGGRPGDRGRNRWGLTEDQLQKILDGQRRHFAPPEPAPEPAGAPRASALSPDGKSRLRKRGAAKGRG